MTTRLTVGLTALLLVVATSIAVEDSRAEPKTEESRIERAPLTPELRQAARKIYRTQKRKPRADRAERRVLATEMRQTKRLLLPALAGGRMEQRKNNLELVEAQKRQLGTIVDELRRSAQGDSKATLEADSIDSALAQTFQEIETLAELPESSQKRDRVRALFQTLGIERAFDRAHNDEWMMSQNFDAEFERGARRDSRGRIITRWSKNAR